MNQAQRCTWPIGMAGTAGTDARSNVKQVLKPWPAITMMRLPEQIPQIPKGYAGRMV